jgi:hypothetical protein
MTGEVSRYSTAEPPILVIAPVRACATLRSEGTEEACNVEVPQKRENTWMSTTAGVLNIVSAAIKLMLVLALAIAAMVVDDAVVFTGAIYWTPVSVTGILWSIAVPLAIAGVLSLVGGIFALQRKQWGWALAGSIAALLPFGLLGMISVILTALSKDAFDRS